LTSALDASNQLHAPAAYPSGKSPLCPLASRMSGPQNQSEHCGEEKLLALAGNRTLAVQNLARSSFLYRFMVGFGTQWTTMHSI
jgi:hypothetical protein